MADPEYVSSSGGTAASNTPTMSYPASLAADDYLLALITHYDVSFASNDIVRGADVWLMPAAWSLGTGGSVAQVNSQGHYHKMVTATDSGSLVYINTRGASGDVFVMLAYRNMRNFYFADPDAASGNGENSGTSGTLTVASSTNDTGTDGPHMVILVGMSEEPTCDFVWPAGYTSRIRQQGGNSVIEVADGLETGSGNWPAQNVDWTKTGSGSKDISVHRLAPYVDQRAVITVP